MTEELREIEECKNYKVSNLGYIFSSKRNIILQPCIDSKGYGRVVLFENKKPISVAIHRAVAKAFPEICGEYFEGAEADHIDGNKRNNRADNLRWVTHKENVYNPNTYFKTIERASERLKTNKTYLLGHKARKKPVVCINTGERFESAVAAAQKYELRKATVGEICRGERKQTKTGLRFAYV